MIINRVGDVGLALALFSLFSICGTLDYCVIFACASHLSFCSFFFVLCIILIIICVLVVHRSRGGVFRLDIILLKVSVMAVMALRLILFVFGVMGITPPTTASPEKWGM